MMRIIDSEEMPCKNCSQSSCDCLKKIERYNSLPTIKLLDPDPLERELEISVVAQNDY